MPQRSNYKCDNCGAPVSDSMRQKDAAGHPKDGTCFYCHQPLEVQGRYPQRHVLARRDPAVQTLAEMFGDEDSQIVRGDGTAFGDDYEDEILRVARLL
jgi:hypothetical protein